MKKYYHHHVATNKVCLLHKGLRFLSILNLNVRYATKVSTTRIDHKETEIDLEIKCISTGTVTRDGFKQGKLKLFFLTDISHEHCMFIAFSSGMFFL